MVRRMAMVAGAIALVMACSGGGSREPMPDSGAGGTANGGAGAAGQSGCTVDSQCAPGLKCCYPCGVPGCANQCTTPLSNGQCPMYP